MKTIQRSIQKHSVTIGGHHTAITLEDEFWDELRHMSIDRHMSVSAIIADINNERLKRRGTNLSSAIRLFILRETQRHLKTGK